jgi:hypothetical protein
MSIRLPDGTFNYPATLGSFAEMERCLRDREPLIVTVKELDGAERVEVIWHPDSPDVSSETTSEFPARSFWQKIFGGT